MSWHDLDFRFLSASRLWRSLEPEERLLAARAFFAHPWSEPTARLN